MFAIRRKSVVVVQLNSLGVAKNLKRKKQWRDLEDQGGQYPEVRRKEAGSCTCLRRSFIYDFVRSRNTTTANAWAITDGKLEISKVVSFKTRITRYTPDMPFIRAHATLTPRSVHL